MIRPRQELEAPGPVQVEPVGVGHAVHRDPADARQLGIVPGCSHAAECSEVNLPSGCIIHIGNLDLGGCAALGGIVPGGRIYEATASLAPSSDWLSFTSDRHGVSLRYPADRTAVKASEPVALHRQRGAAARRVADTATC